MTLVGDHQYNNLGNATGSAKVVPINYSMIANISMEPKLTAMRIVCNRVQLRIYYQIMLIWLFYTFC